MGFSKAVFKSFKNEEEARDFLQVQTDRGAPVENKANAKSTAHLDNTTVSSAPPDEPIPRKRQRIDPSTMSIKINFDGGARGNPGIAGAGAVVVCNLSPSYSKTIHYRYYLGEKSTNNEAEYQGLITALQVAHAQLKHLSFPSYHMVVQGDSNLIIQQLNDAYKVKSEKLIPLFQQVKALQNSLKPSSTTTSVADIIFEHVYREYNGKADELANQAMDAQRSWITTSDDAHQQQFTSLEEIFP